MKSTWLLTTRSLGGKSAVKPESLGPTSDATGKHSERVYHTLQGWCGNDLPPEQWGWEIWNVLLKNNQMCLQGRMYSTMYLHRIWIGVHFNMHWLQGEYHAKTVSQLIWILKNNTFIVLTIGCFKLCIFLLTVYKL